MDKETFSALWELLITHSPSNWTVTRKSKMHFFYLIEWILYFIILIITWVGIMVSGLPLFVAILFIIIHVSLFNFPVKTKTVRVFSLLSLLLPISLVFTYLLGLIWLDAHFGIVVFFLGPVMITLVSIPLWIVALMQALGYRKELNIQLTNQTN